MRNIPWLIICICSSGRKDPTSEQIDCTKEEEPLAFQKDENAMQQRLVKITETLFIAPSETRNLEARATASDNNYLAEHKSYDILLVSVF